jgi:hypothetical protein
VIESKPDASTAPQVAVHHQPNLHRKAKLGVKQWHEILLSPRDPKLANAYTKSCAQGRELGEIAVGAKRERVGGERHAHPFQNWCIRPFAVKPDQGVLAKILQFSRHRARLQVAPVGVESDIDSANSFRDQGALLGPDHSDRDVRVATQEIFITVR